MDKPTHIFAENIEQGALDQFESAMKMDFAIKGALMPDTHLGYALPIGAVVATDNMVVPAWVGYDIGCGMCAVKMPVDIQEVRTNATNIFHEIYKHIPVGFNNRMHSHTFVDVPRRIDLSSIGQEAFDARKGTQAIGSLGSGNHFIEIGHNGDQVWIIIHSGSRGVGYRIAQSYMALASPDGKARDDHYGLRADSLVGEAYINDMNWAIDFAYKNRQEMLYQIFEAVGNFCDVAGSHLNVINRTHNHTELKDGLWIHRKGATHAEEGMRGVIPGNMRDGSFIVTGKGNPDSLYSSSHGAGRVLGRNAAKRTLNLDEFQTTMQNITAKVEEATLDESPLAYKNIFDVMKLQSNLVTVDCHVKPIINIKA